MDTPKVIGASLDILGQLLINIHYIIVLTQFILPMMPCKSCYLSMESTKEETSFHMNNFKTT